MDAETQEVQKRVEECRADHKQYHGEGPICPGYRRLCQTGVFLVALNAAREEVERLKTKHEACIASEVVAFDASLEQALDETDTLKARVADLERELRDANALRTSGEKE